MRNSIFALALSLAAVTAFAPGRAQACSCLPQNLIGQYWSAWNTDVFRGVVRSSQNIGNGKVVYRIHVTNTFKGCIRPGSQVRVVTADNGATCGVFLSVGSEYVLTANDGGGGALSINLCGGNQLWTSLTQDEQTFLNNRYVCCNGNCRCATGGQVLCFAQPCAVDQCASPGATCVDNYCNGCGAEWFDGSSAPVCYPCQSDFDCNWTQTCVAGECL